MELDKRRVWLVTASLALAALALTAVGLVVMQIGAHPVLAARPDPLPAAVTRDVIAQDAEPLTITKTSPTDSVVPDELLTYTITITNSSGGDPLTGVVVTDTLPVSTTFEYGTSGWGQVGASTLYTYPVDVLTDTATLTLTVKLADIVPAHLHAITNTVEATDDNGAHAQATAVNSVAAAASLEIRKTDGVTHVVPGELLAYTITITNTGNREAVGVVVTDTLPVSTTFEGGTPGWDQASASTYTYSLSSLYDPHTLTLTARLTDTVLPGLVEITNTVEVTAVGVAAESYHKRTSVTAAPDLTIDKTADRDPVPPGQTVTYTIAIANEGNQGATGVVVTDTLPSAEHTDFVTPSHDGAASNGIVVWPAFNLPAGASTTRTLAVQLNAAPWPAGVVAITNTVAVADDGTNGFTDTVTATARTGVDAGPDLYISKSVSTPVGGDVEPGAVIVYKLNYGNTGSQNATGVVITETLPDNTTYHAAGSTPGWAQVGASGIYTYPVGALAAQTADSVYFAVAVDATLPAGVESITNQVHIADDGTSGPDLDPQDNHFVRHDPVDAAPDLAAVKDDGLDVVDPGQVITYLLTISNVGTQGATGVVVTDTLPQATTFVTASHSGVAAGDAVVWDDLSLPAGDSFTRTLTVQVVSPLPVGVDAITNTVTVADDGLNGDDLNPDNNTAVDVNAVWASPAVALFKTDDRTSVIPGDVLTYTITAKNVGQQNAAGLTLTDILPDHTTFLAASHGGVPSAGQVVWTGIDLPVREEHHRTVTVQVDKPLPPYVSAITNTAQIEGPGVYDIAVDVNAVAPVVDLVLTKDGPQESVGGGDLLTYTLTITNAGTATATGVALSDVLPTPAGFVTASHGGAAHAGVVTWPDFTLSPGDATYRTVTVQMADVIPVGLKAITNTASVSDDGTHGPDLDPSDNTDQHVTLVAAAAELALSKAAGVERVRPGDVITYTMAITNTGDRDAAGVVLTETLPVSTTFVGPADEWARVGQTRHYTHAAGGLLGGGGVYTATFVVQVDTPVPAGLMVITNTLEVADDAGGYAPAVEVTPVDAAAELALSKAAGVERVRPGDVITYALAITNTGHRDAAGVVVTETLPLSTTFVGPADDWARVGQTRHYTHAVGGLPGSGGVYTATFVVQVDTPVPAGLLAVTNTVELADDAGGYATAVEVTPLDVPLLAIAKGDGGATVRPGDTLTYTITLSNTGGRAAASVVVTDTLPTHTTFVSASGGVTPVGGKVTWELDGLAVYEVVTVTLTVEVDEPLSAGVQEIVNTVAAVGDGVLVTASAVTAVEAAPNLRVVKTDGRLSARPGETLTYTLMVDNLGTQGATGIVLTDTLPAHVTFAAASDGATHSAGVVTWPPFTLDVGEVVTRTLTVVIDDPWPAGGDTLLVNRATVADDGDSGDDLDPDLNTAVALTRVLAYDIYLPLISKR